ncbi:MAG: membrane protein insertion efficiency factor YidD [bacterium]
MNSLTVLLLTLTIFSSFPDYAEKPFDKNDTMNIYYNEDYDKTLVESSLNVIFLGSIRFYQEFISPAQGEVCNFTPSCSNYMFKAVRKYGPAGILMGINRLQRCNHSATGYLGLYYKDVVKTRDRGYKIIDNP